MHAKSNALDQAILLVLKPSTPQFNAKINWPLHRIIFFETEGRQSSVRYVDSREATSCGRNALHATMPQMSFALWKPYTFAQPKYVEFKYGKGSTELAGTEVKE